MDTVEPVLTTNHYYIAIMVLWALYFLSKIIFKILKLRKFTRHPYSPFYNLKLVYFSNIISVALDSIWSNKG
ncbi:hypothetical protein J2Z64_000102 [Oceanobacillus polygoni]|uniref:Uncharacterized protein n=1 Tax=Oceanobacillus polygoni TaxID=1235259 RepID=A0A9X0YPX1_9BACI|nr:hypothetical protein [Oceanobacillus polygoni]